MMSHHGTDSYMKSVQVARQVLPFLGEKHIPAVPENYMIFYLYFEGGNQRVEEIVDQSLNNRHPWSEETTEEVFEALFGSRANLELLRMNIKLAKEVQETTKGIMQQTSASALAAQKTSQRISSSMEKAGQFAEVQEVAEWLRATLSEVDQVKEISNELGSSLRHKGDQLEGIVSSLSQLEKDAQIDHLTQLANRRAWDKRLETEYARYKRYRHPCAIVMLDIDDFKDINDLYGHLVGDKALREVARILSGGLRETDFAARFGGEEFTCLLPETDLAGAGVVAERVRRRLASTVFTVRGQETRITASLGVAIFAESDLGPRPALDRADQAMYLAKSKGKNRIYTEVELRAARKATMD